MAVATPSCLFREGAHRGPFGFVVTLIEASAHVVINLARPGKYCPVSVSRARAGILTPPDSPDSPSHDSESGTPPRSKRRPRNPPLTLVLGDLAVLVFAYYLALLLRFEGAIPEEFDLLGSFPYFLLLALPAHLLVNWVAGNYSFVHRYIGLSETISLGRASAVASLFLLVADYALRLEGTRLVPLSVVIIGGFQGMAGMIAIRFYHRILRQWRNGKQDKHRRLLIVGAGAAADMIIREIEVNSSLGITVVGLVDDNPHLQGKLMHGYSILGGVADVPRLVEHHSVHEILIALPSATGDQLKQILKIVRPAGLPIKTLPSLTDIVNGRVSLRDARDLCINDLLGRERVETDLGQIEAYLRGKRVLITGAAGSIGSELSRQILQFGPAELILVDRDESGLFYLQEELRQTGASNYLIKPTSVALPKKMERVFRDLRPQVVFHAAALKHVPLMELNPDEAVINNVKGTITVGDMAGRYGAERVINISTDKAVNPVNVMGATKKAGEYVIGLLAERHPQTRFTSVRFGNVLGSQGSVIPVFHKQIAAGGPVTVTHPDMTRYFMTISEAVQLVLQAAALQDEMIGPPGVALDLRNGPVSGVFVLEMGRPIRIMDLARQMVELLGDGSGHDIPIKITGLRPGEKLHEEVLAPDESVVPTPHPLIYFAPQSAVSLDWTHANGNGHGATGEDNGSGNGYSGEVRECRLQDLTAAETALFECRLGRVIGLAEQGAETSSIIGALMDLVPTYSPLMAQLEGESLSAMSPSPPLEGLASTDLADS